MLEMRLNALKNAENLSGCRDLNIMFVQNRNYEILTIKGSENRPWTIFLLRDKAALKALIQSFEDHDAGICGGKSPEEVFTDLT